MATPLTLTLSIVNDGTGTSVTATVAYAVPPPYPLQRSQLFYKRLSDEAWTAGSERAGEGAIVQTGLANGKRYEFLAISRVDLPPPLGYSYYGLPSAPAYVHVTKAGAVDNAIEEIAKAVRIAALADATLMAAAPGGIHLNEAPPGASYPYLIVDIYSDPYRAFGIERFELAVVAFSCVDENRSVKGTLKLTREVRRVFENAPLAVSGYNVMSFLESHSTAPIHIDERWEADVEYECQLQRTS